MWGGRIKTNDKYKTKQNKLNNQQPKLHKTKQKKQKLPTTN